MAAERNADRAAAEPPVNGVESAATESLSQGRQVDRRVDLISLKALAHPLRVNILDQLSKFGPMTASGLAERLGESSGATSYHLRQLAKHDFVREVEGRGNARERWWKRAPQGITMDPAELSDTPAGREAYDLVNREFRRSQEAALVTFMSRAMDEIPAEWIEASTISTSNLRMTVEELKVFSRAIYAAFDDAAAAYRDRVPPAGARPVQLQFNAFPIVGGTDQES